MEAVVRASPWRWYVEVQKIPWSLDPAPGQIRLRIGLILECPSWPVAPSLKETLKSAASRLAEKGSHKIVPLTSFPSFDAAMQLCWQLFDLDSEHTSVKNIDASGEPQVQAVAT
jgi:hypothetical protein